MRKNSIPIILFGSFLLGVIGFMITKKVPFGILFHLSIFLFIAGLIGLIAYTAYKWFKRSIVKKIVASLLALLALLLLLVVIVGFHDVRMLMPSVSSRSLTKEQWIEDFEYLDKSLQKHPAYNDSLGRIIDSYRSRLESLANISDHEAMLTSMRMVSSFKDGHSNVMPFQLYLRTRYLPIQTYAFADGIYIVNAGTNNELIGGRIVSINDQPIDTVLQKISPLTGADNSFFAQYQSSLYIPNLDILTALDVTTSTKEASLGIMINGELITKKLTSISMIKWLFWSLAPSDDLRPVGHNIRNEENRVKVNNDTLLWMTFNQTGPEGLLTAIGNNIRNQTYGTVINHLVIDMRNNTGGDNTSYNDFIKALSESAIDLTLLTSRKTFSAGINFISELKLRREFRIIGEPTGAGHNHYGDAQTLFLPNSGIMFMLSTRKWEFIPELSDNSIAPDIRINYFSSEYFGHLDPWLNALEANPK